MLDCSIITITDANDNFQFNFNEKLVCNPHARFIAFVLLSICLRTHRVLEADSKKCFQFTQKPDICVNRSYVLSSLQRWSASSTRDSTCRRNVERRTWRVDGFRHILNQHLISDKKKDQFKNLNLNGCCALQKAKLESTGTAESCKTYCKQNMNKFCRARKDLGIEIQRIGSHYYNNLRCDVGSFSGSRVFHGNTDGLNSISAQQLWCHPSFASAIALLVCTSINASASLLHRQLATMAVVKLQCYPYVST